MSRTNRQQKLLEAKRSYHEKPLLRRAKVCESILGGAAVAAFVILSCVVQVGRFVEDEVFGWVLVAIALVACAAFVGAVVFVSALALTGPIYKQQLDFASGDLETWGSTDKAAAVALTLLAMFSVGYIVYRFLL
ncbi:hypothetical protein [Aporhodopirellula aestuarii]|uniref:Uncharacterized protein n=1 Tax=Aporhodopirellula aestuarii TaxID=2950107 RepID=A0ABT0UDZ9_9BACT|nr:hypothetical protein [Aporhodopirellula aestuarii]MCM2375119.1 hypothetical protein [Aporhodopirellula aestuarii]